VKMFTFLDTETTGNGPADRICQITFKTDNFITSRLVPPCAENDGKQTPMKGHSVFIAQHATANRCPIFLKK